MVQWIRLQAPITGGPRSIPGWGTRSQMPQQIICRLQGKDPTCHSEFRSKPLRAATKTLFSQISIFFKLSLTILEALACLSCISQITNSHSVSSEKFFQKAPSTDNRIVKFLFTQEAITIWPLLDHNKFLYCITVFS